jgi:hypothetical protein
MNKQRKTSNILNVFQYNETTKAVTLPSTLDLTAPGSSDDSTKAPTTAWVRALISSLGYVTLASDQTITGLKTIVRSGDVLNFKIGTDNLYALKIVYNQNELVESGEATWSFANTFNNGSGTGITTTPISFFRGVLVTGQRLLSASVNTNLIAYYGNNPSGRYPVFAYNTGVQQFASSIIVGETAGVVNAATGAIADLPAGVVANFKGRVIGSNAVNNNEFVTLGQIPSLTGYVTGTGASGQVAYFTGTSAIASGSNFLFDASQRNLTIDRSLSTLGNAITISKLGDSDQAWLAFRQGGGSSGTWRLGYTGSVYDFRINVGSDGSIGTQALRIFQSSQNVVIGTATDDGGAKLQVSGTISGGGNIELVNGSGPYVLVGQGTGTNQYGTIDWDATNNRLRIATQPFAFGANGGQITLNTAGNVGIGRVPSSGFKLDIQGNGGLRILDNDVLRSIILIPPTSAAAANLESSSANGLNINSSNASGNINFLTAGSPRLTISSTGAATFSSSVTATIGTFASTGIGLLNSQIVARNTTSAAALITFENTANGFTFGFSSSGTGGQRFSFFNGAPTEIAYITAAGAANFNNNITSGASISASGNIIGSLFQSSESNVSGVGTSFVNSGIVFGNETGVWLVSITAFGDGNMYSAALYVVTTGAFSKTINLIGGPSNHFGNGSVVAQLSTSEGVSANLQVRRTTSGSALVFVKIIRTGS